MCCSPGGRRVRHDSVTVLNGTELKTHGEQKLHPCENSRWVRLSPCSEGLGGGKASLSQRLFFSHSGKIYELLLCIWHSPRHFLLLWDFGGAGGRSYVCPHIRSEESEAPIG